MNSLDPFEVSISGINLIEASAGTGKTYTIASLYVRALIERDIEVSRFLVVTYTEAATKELRDRLLRRLRDSVRALEGKTYEDGFLGTLPGRVPDRKQAILRLRKAIRSFDEAAVYTIHGFCYQALQERAFESRALFESDMIGDDSRIVSEVIDDYWRRWVGKISEEPDRRPLLKLLMDRGFTPESLTEEFSGYIDKPYLKVRPEKPGNQDLKSRLQELEKLYNELQEQWRTNREEIFRLLDADYMSNYRTAWLEKWAAGMDECLRGEVPQIELFDMFKKFTQSEIDRNVTKSAREQGATPPQHPFFRTADAYREIAGALGNYDLLFRLELFRHLREVLPSKKEELQQLSYSDLLVQLHEALTDARRGNRLARLMRESYPVALVDEFQDTDPVQYEIFTSIYAGADKIYTRADKTYKNADEGTALFMIGDPKQSIYSFRGADIYSYLRARGDLSEQDIYRLERNFRSVPELIRGVNTLFGSVANPFIMKEISFSPVKPGKPEGSYHRLIVKGEEKPPVELRKLYARSEELPLNIGVALRRCARDTAYQIRRLLDESDSGQASIGGEKVDAGDIAVLVRSHYQADVIREALHEKGINSVQYSRDSVFKSEEASQLQYVLEAVSEPANESLVRTALATPLLGYKAEELIIFDQNESAWVEKLDQFAGWRDSWREHSFSYMFRQILKDESIPKKMVSLKNGERRLTNLLHLSELIQREEKNGRIGARSVLKWLSRKEEEEAKDREEEQLRLESDENLVKVVTMHRSKGLEYPIVFCPYLWHSPRHRDEGGPIVYHDREDPSTVYLDLHGKNDPDRDKKRYKAAREQLAESMRLAYVAVTRAQHKCVITWMPAKRAEYSALGYLLLGEKEALERLRGKIFSNLKYDPADPEKFEQPVARLLNDHPDLFYMDPEEDEGRQKQETPETGSASLTCRSFERKKPLYKGASISSFSGLVRDRPSGEETIFEPYSEIFPLTETGEQGGEEDTVFSFPRGPGPGTAIHHMFEQVDFTTPGDLPEIVNRQLERHNISLRWEPVVTEMISGTLDKNLFNGGNAFMLSSLSKGQYTEEMEFYFKSGNSSLAGLLELIREDGRLPDRMSGFAESGFMKGYIDLVFRHDSKYYILDYKTNYLGDSIEDYQEEKVHKEIRESMYDLQYHLYTVALHRYLQQVKRDYSYERHFGGVYYLFLRGINKQGNEGIFFDLPGEKVIDRLDHYLNREEHV